MDNLHPQLTRLGRIFDALVHWRETFSGVYYIVRTSGFKALLTRVMEVVKREDPTATISTVDLPFQAMDISSFMLPEERTDIEPTNVSVSVVIPTLNGADDLIKLLPALHNQNGFERIEIIVVDSGSIDESVRLAKAYGATVIQIDKNSFSHSFARNVGGEQASGDYLLFTVQDAFPPSHDWLHRMFTFLKHEHLAAVSCKEKPRADADLFSRVENWYHEREILLMGERDKVLSQPEQQDARSLRANAQLSNVACLMSREVFLRYKFRGIYAEDLDLGLRLLGDGTKIGIMNTTSIIHSHTRLPYDYLKRGFTDKFCLTQLLREPLESTHSQFESFIQDIFFTQNVFTRLKLPKRDKRFATYSVDEFATLTTNLFTAFLADPTIVDQNVNNLKFVDDKTKKFLEQLHTKFYRKGANAGAGTEGNLIKGILQFLNITFEYLRTVYDVLDDHVVHDFQTLQYQYFINLVGRDMAVWHLKFVDEGSEKLKPVVNELLYGNDTWGETHR